MDNLKFFLRAHPSVLPLSFVFVTFLIIILFVGSGLTARQVRLLTHASSVSAVDPSVSLVFANPLSVSNANTPVNIKVQLRDKDSVAIPGVDVTLKAVDGSIAAATGGNISATSNDKGIAEFSVVLPELKPTKIQAFYGPSQLPIARTVLIQVISL